MAFVLLRFDCLKCIFSLVSIVSLRPHIAPNSPVTSTRRIQNRIFSPSHCSELCNYFAMLDFGIACLVHKCRPHCSQLAKLDGTECNCNPSNHRIKTHAKPTVLSAVALPHSLLRLFPSALLSAHYNSLVLFTLRAARTHLPSIDKEVIFSAQCQDPIKTIAQNIFAVCTNLIYTLHSGLFMMRCRTMPIYGLFLLVCVYMFVGSLNPREKERAERLKEKNARTHKHVIFIWGKHACCLAVICVCLNFVLAFLVPVCPWKRCYRFQRHLKSWQMEWSRR